MSSFFGKFTRGVKEELPELAGDVVQVGAEGLAQLHGMGPIEAKEVGAIARFGFKGIAAWTNRHADAGSKDEEEAILRVVRSPDPTVTPCWFVYAMPVRNGRVEDDVLAVAPRIWLSSQQASLYAENVAFEDMGLARTPRLISQDVSFADETADPLTATAWERWRQERKNDARPIAPNVVYGPFVLGDLKEGGVVAWTPVLSRHGVRVGTLTDAYTISVDDTPKVFENDAAAREEMERRGIVDPLDFKYMPPSLEAELKVDEHGGLRRIRPHPLVWPGDPVKANVDRRFAPDPDPVLLRPDWYASTDTDGMVWAWRPVAEGQVSFARVQDADGRWKTARWGSIEQCLRDLGDVGEFAQVHPTLVVTPSLSVAPKLKVVEGPNL
jgi:hypothetical protein